MRFIFEIHMQKWQKYDQQQQRQTKWQTQNV